MNQVRLVGDIGDKFGYKWSLNAANFKDIIDLIDCQIEGFRSYLINSEKDGIRFTVQRGKEFIDPETAERDLLLSLNDEDIIITAVPQGASGWFKTIVGFVLAVVGIVYQIPWLATIGMQLMMAGIAEIGLPKKIGDESDGHFFDGPDNTIVQGNPVPVLYGELLIGGAPISVAFSTKPVDMSHLQYIQNDYDDDSRKNDSNAKGSPTGSGDIVSGSSQNVQQWEDLTVWTSLH